jgi:hypothetical protein
MSQKFELNTIYERKNLDCTLLLHYTAQQTIVPHYCTTQHNRQFVMHFAQVVTEIISFLKTLLLVAAKKMYSF